MNALHNLLKRTYGFSNKQEVEQVLELIYKSSLTDINDIDPTTGKSCLQTAIKTEQIDIIEALVKKGSNINFQQRDYVDHDGTTCAFRDTALHMLATFPGTDKFRDEAISLLIKHGANYSMENNAGFTPLKKGIGSLSTSRYAGVEKAFNYAIELRDFMLSKQFSFMQNIINIQQRGNYCDTMIICKNHDDKKKYDIDIDGGGGGISQASASERIIF